MVSKEDYGVYIDGMVHVVGVIVISDLLLW